MRTFKEYQDGVAVGYDKMHLPTVGGMRTKNAAVELIPPYAEHILNLGAGTGLEIDKMLVHCPKLKRIDCIDMSPLMLEQLTAKYQTEKVRVFCADYFNCRYIKKHYDAVFSCMSLHHHFPEDKRYLYEKIADTLVDAGVFINNDIFAKDIGQELGFRNKKINTGTDHEEFDKPTCIGTEIGNLKSAGFREPNVYYHSVISMNRPIASIVAEKD